MIGYFHGFASGPGSLKARRFAEALARVGVPLTIPALDEGDFEHLTLGRQRALVERLFANMPRPHVVVGSSMGGYLALLHASAHDVDAVIAMAPAVDFAAIWRDRVGPADLAEWERTNRVLVDHHVTGRPEPLAFDLMRDAPTHAPWPVVRAPTLVFQGLKDDVVPPDRVRRWAASTPSATLVELDDGHELTASIELICARSLSFLASVPAVRARWPSLEQR